MAWQRSGKVETLATAYRISRWHRLHAPRHPPRFPERRRTRRRRRADACRAACATCADAPYPPGETGSRGSTPASYETAHAIRDGQRFDLGRVTSRKPAKSSSSAQACADWPPRGSGGSVGRRRASWSSTRTPISAATRIATNSASTAAPLVSYGGSESLQSPSTLWGDDAKALMRAIGVDLRRFETAFDRTLYPSLGLSRGVFFTREAFGADVLVTGDPMRMVADDIPPDRMNARAPQRSSNFPVVRADGGPRRGLHVDARSARRQEPRGEGRDPRPHELPPLADRSTGGSTNARPSTFHGRSLDFFAIGTDAVPARDAFDTGYPGFEGVGVARDEDAVEEMEEPYIHHFPDGNASLARLMVRRLVPGVAPGRRWTTSSRRASTTRGSTAPARRRASASTAPRSIVRNRDGGVDVGYVRDGKLARVRAGHCVMRRLPHDDPVRDARAARANSARRWRRTSRRRSSTSRSRCATGSRGSNAACTRSATRWASTRA